MSVNAVDWALRFAPVDARHNGAARVLMCLANVADDEGRNAHPTHRKLAAWCKCSVSTVKRHLSWLEANGLIRRGDQRQAGHFSEWHRPVVWDLCLGNRLELDSDFFDSNDIDSTRGGRPSTKNPGPHVDPGSDTESDDNHGSHVDRGYGDGDTGNPGSRVNHGSQLTPPPAHLVSYSTSLVRNNPSAPTGHLPASGATAAEKNKTEQLDEDDTEIAEAAGRVLASLGAQRSMLGLATPSPTKADRKAIIGLYRRLVDQGAQWPTLVMVDAIGFAMNGDWWPKRIRTGRALARHWDELNDDMILAAGRTDGDAHAQTVPAAVPEPDAAPWLPDWAVETLAELDGQDATAGGEATA